MSKKPAASSNSALAKSASVAKVLPTERDLSQEEVDEQVLDLLSKSSPIRYRIKKATRLSDNSYSKREIIIN